MKSNTPLRNQSWLSLLLMALMIPPLLASALTVMTVPATAETVTFVPPKAGAPRNSKGGASRTTDLACAATLEKGLALLTPASSNYGLTSAERPTLLAYVPATPAKQIFVNLRDEAGETYYQSTLPIKGNGEVVSVTLPATARALEVGKRYRWGVAVLCTGKLRPDSPFAESWIERTALPANVVGKLGQATPLEQANLYGTNGIWYDMLATLSQLRQTDSSQQKVADRTWNEILKSAGLGSVATETSLTN